MRRAAVLDFFALTRSGFEAAGANDVRRADSSEGEAIGRTAGFSWMTVPASGLSGTAVSLPSNAGSGSVLNTDAAYVHRCVSRRVCQECVAENTAIVVQTQQAAVNDQ
jgi:hypothetical protein